MAEWWTQQPEPKWSPKDSGREERHGTYVNGHPVQKTEQEMEPLRAVMEPPQEENEMQMEGKRHCLLRTVLVDGHPLGLKWLQTAQCLFTSLSKLPLHLFVCVRLIHRHARCVCVANHSLNLILVWFCDLCKDLWTLNYKVRQCHDVDIHLCLTKLLFAPNLSLSLTTCSTIQNITHWEGFKTA